MTAAAAPIDAPAQRHVMGLAAAATAVVVWGVSSVAIKQVDGLDGLGVATYRVWMGAAMITVLHVVRGGTITMRLLRLSALGGLAFCADLVLFFCSVQLTSVANATVIGALQPLLVLVVAGPMFGERAQRMELVWGAVAIVGVVVVVLGGDGGGANSLEGDLLAVGALVSWTAYFVFTKTARVQLSAGDYLTGMSIVAAIAVVPIPLLAPGTLAGTTTSGWATLVYLTVVNGLIGHFLMSWAHGHVTLLTISLLTLAIPVFAAGAAYVLIDEPLSLVQIGGMAVVLVSLALVSLHTARRAPDLAEADIEAIEAAPYP